MRLVIPWCGVLLVVLSPTAGGQRFASSPLAAADTSVFREIERWRSVEPRGIKSGATASWLSVSATLLPAAAGVALLNGESVVLPTFFIVSGLVVGPSAGHFYVGRSGGVLLRLGVGAISTAVAFTAASNEGGYGGIGVLVGVMAAGSAIIVIDGIYDIARLGSVVRRYNARQVSRALIARPIVYAASWSVGFGMRLEFSRGR